MKRLALLLALAGCGHRAPAPAPTITNTPEEHVVTGAADIMIVLDLSSSMQETDLVPDRLGATKSALHDLVAAETRARLGLIVFAQEVRVRAALGTDLTTLDDTIASLQIGDVPPLGTGIGDALGVAVDALRASPSCKVVLLLADGDNNWVAQYTPEQAAALATEAGVVVHTLLVGAVDDSTNPKVLEDIAAATGGSFRRATDAAGLGAALDELRAAIRAIPGC